MLLFCSPKCLVWKMHTPSEIDKLKMALGLKTSDMHQGSKSGQKRSVQNA